jgi:hypothetical protein
MVDSGAVTASQPGAYWGKFQSWLRGAAIANDVVILKKGTSLQEPHCNLDDPATPECVDNANSRAAFAETTIKMSIRGMARIFTGTSDLSPNTP